MKTKQDINWARAVCASHEDKQQTEEQRAVLYGIRVGLGLIKYKWPMYTAAFADMLNDACNSYTPDRKTVFRPIYLHSEEREKTAADLIAFRELTGKCITEMTMPPQYVLLLRGMCVAMAWAAELPKGGLALQRMLDEEALSKVLPRNEAGKYL